MKSDVAIKVENVTKDFHLPRHKSDSLKQTITQVFKPKDKTVDVYHALKGISFEIKKGEFFGILGRNGSGKSTLLKIISEIYRPTSGEVSHNGSLVSFIELGVGFKAELSGRENIYLNGALLGFSKKEIDERYNEIVAFTELEDFMEQKLKNYSSGMKVRLAFAVAIQAKSDILILDEVLAVGDASFQKKCYDYFKSLKEDESKTIVFVTHSMSAVREYCDRAILIENGVIAYEGAPEQVADRYSALFEVKNHTSDEKAKHIGTVEALIDSVTSTVKDDTVEISVKVRGGSNRLEDVIAGLEITNQKKQWLTGVSHEVAQNNKFDLNPNQDLALTYTFPNYFGRQKYYVTASLMSTTGKKVYDKLFDATVFSNPKSSSVALPLVIPITVTKETIE